MILLLAVAIPALVGAIVIAGAVTQRCRERSLGADIAALRRWRAASAAMRLPVPANDAFPVMANVRRRGDRLVRQVNRA
jgi:hypothetical protein